MSRRTLAEATKTDARTIADIEREQRNPKFSLLFGIVHTLELPPELLFWPNRTSYTHDQEWLLHALQECNDQEKEVFFRIARAYFQS